MASRHHHGCLRRQNHHEFVPLFATSSRCCTYTDSSPCCTPSPPPSPDSLLHLLASYLQNHQQEEKFPDQTCPCENPCRRRRQGVSHQQKNVPREHDNVILSCLLRKIEDLESSLNEFSASHDQRRDRRYSSLRDSAARVIQTHFRSHLVRRSVSLRHLKELSTIKSSFVALKTSVSGKTHLPLKLVSRKATDLLLQLDSIQGRIDPMIRTSKRSLSRELVRFLHYIDDCAVKRYDVVAKPPIKVSFVASSCSKLRGSDGKKPQAFGVAEDRRVEKLRNRMGKVYVTSSGDEDSNAEVEELDFMTDDSEEVTVKSSDKGKIGSSKSRTVELMKGSVVKPLVRKAMVLDKNRKVYQVYENTDELTSSAEEDTVDSGEETLVISKDTERRHGSKTRKMVLVKESGGKQRVVKTVNFDENGNIYKVYGDTPESSISGEANSINGSNDGNVEEKGSEVEEEIKYVPKENKSLFEEEEEEEEEETNSENEVTSSEGSEEETIVTRNANHRGSDEHKRDIHPQKGNSMVSPPLPLKMEP